MASVNNNLSFRVSAGLKNIIGRDLISDKYIAVFELVKNSYDAGASKVNISFTKTKNGKSQIVISDNGCGMSYTDIIEKWLFVAYSEKKPQNRKKPDFRNKIKREIAGAKGVGRFSCDRLGSLLNLVTKTKIENYANSVDVNWNDFEYDDTKEFINIPVKYSTIEKLPSGFDKGTTLIVDDLREEWDRDSLLKLKRSLMKLISPDANNDEFPFDIELIVPDESECDATIQSKEGINPDRDIVNGIIRNDIFEKLNIKTTCIEVSISDDGSQIITKLTDRGEYIFSVIEKNRDYYKLQNIKIKIFFLNQSAKLNFTRQMGVHAKGYGSVFIYKNGFRINPYGEPGQDFFGIDQRKAQGYKRYLGTREIMGRISIMGENDEFIETTSRAHGFIQNEAVEMLANLFVDKVLKVLERYVVNLINWGEPLTSDPQHTISPNEIGDKIIAQFITGVNHRDILEVDYNPAILADNEKDSIVTSLKKLESVAEQTQDSALVDLALSLKNRTESIISYNRQLEEENIEKESELKRTKQKAQAREQQVFFLQGTANQDVTNLVNGFHTIFTMIDATRGNIAYLRSILSKSNIENKEVILTLVGQIYQSNERAHKLANLAIHGNQTLKQIEAASILDFIKQYRDNGFALKGLTYVLPEESYAYACKFDASSVGIIIDNIASNSIKAGATLLNISFSETNKYVDIVFSDNGNGLTEDINPSELFEWGYSTNKSKKGFGIGLYHIKQLVDEMKGSVEIDTNYHDGFRIKVRLKK